MFSQTDDKRAAVEAFKEDVLDKILLLNVEYKLSNNLTAVTLAHASTNYDIGKGLISDGFVHVQKHRDRRLTKLVSLFFSFLLNDYLQATIYVMRHVHIVAILYTRRDLQIEEYKKAEEDAKHNHRNIWMYGDVRPEDDDKEFGL